LLQFYLGTSLHESVLCRPLIEISYSVTKTAEKYVVYQLSEAFSTVWEI